LAFGLDSGRERGGTCRLLELIEEHRAEITYDFRSRFNLSVLDIGGSVSFHEAALLVSILLRDTSSWLCASYNKWDYPVSREWIVAAHTYDLLSMVNSGKGKKPKPYPTPMKNLNKQRVGKTDLPFEEAVKILERMNPKET
jgi:hypothetical protein